MTLFLTRAELEALRRAVSLLKLNKATFALAILFGSLGLGSAIALAAVSAWLIARASQHPPVLFLSVAVVSVRTFGISRAVLRYVERLTSHYVALRGMANLRAEVYRRLSESRTDTITKLRRGDLLSRLGADVDAVGDLIVRSILPILVSFIVGIGTVIGFFFLSPQISLVMAGCLLLSGVGGPLFTMRATRLTELSEQSARTELSAATMTYFDASSELLVSGQAGPLLDHLHAIEKQLTQIKDAASRPAAAAATLDSIAVGIATISALVIGISQMSTGYLSAVALAVVVLTPLASFEGTAMLAPAAKQLVRSAGAAQRITELLAENPDARTAQKTPVPPGPPVLCAHDLSIGWANHPVLATGINLELRPGARVALVGPSGIGKTTLLLTLAGMIPPAAGTLTLNGVDLWGARRQDVTERINYTAEDAHLFATTVLENLRVARGELTETAATRLLHTVGLGDWIDNLPHGLQTVLGSDGATVSGGERRRLLLARALASPAELLLLDEPAEHIDPETADALVSDLLTTAGAESRGVLLITHRLSGLENADEVIILRSDQSDSGARIVGRGTHSKMIEDDPTYRWSLQQENIFLD